MTRYTATFADGTTITRNSKRNYAAAWRSTWVNDKGHHVSFTGFCGSPEKANPEKPMMFWFGNSAADKAKAKRKNAEYLEKSGYRVEIVPAFVA